MCVKNNQFPSYYARGISPAKVSQRSLLPDLLGGLIPPGLKELVKRIVPQGQDENVEAAERMFDASVQPNLPPYDTGLRPPYQIAQDDVAERSLIPLSSPFQDLLKGFMPTANDATDVTPRFFNPLNMVTGPLKNLFKSVLPIDVSARGLLDSSSMITAALPLMGLPPVVGDLIKSLLSLFEVFQQAISAVFKK